MCLVDKQIPAQVGNLCMITGGANAGRVGSMVSRCVGGNGSMVELEMVKLVVLVVMVMPRERHPGSFDICHIKDTLGHVFATRLGYVFVIGKVCRITLFLTMLP